MTLIDLQSRINTTKTQFIRLQTEYNLLRNQYADIEKIILNTSNQIVLHEQVRKLLEIFVKSVEYKVRDYIEPVITEALDYVFNQGLRFHLIFITRRDQIEVDFILLKGEDSEKIYQEFLSQPIKHEKQLEQLIKETKNLNFLYGGAVNQVLALVLRLVLVELLKIEGPVFLDEPSSAVGEEYSARLGQFISSLSKKFNRQIVLITHSKTLASYADKIYEVTQINGISKVTNFINS